MKIFLYGAAILHYLIAAFMFVGAVVHSSEVDLIAFAAFACCGTVAGMWAWLVGRSNPAAPHQTMPGV